MRALSEATNVDGESGDYPNGRVRTKAGEVAGTIYNEVLHGDLIQAIQKIIIDAGVVPNGTPDNVSNGYQIVQALDILYRFIATTEKAGIVEKATTLEASQGVSGKFIDAALLQTVEAKTNIKGLAELATAAESKASTDDARILTPKQAHDRGFGAKVTIAQSGSNYSIPDNVSEVEITFAGISTQIVNTPTPKGGRIIMLYTDNVQTVDEGMRFDSNANWYTTQDSFDPLTKKYQIAMISDGNKWMALNWSNLIIACPFIYLNGVYFDEILKNYNGIENYKVETIDITSVVKQGNNSIWLTEEKSEITYIDYLDLIVDGVVKERFFNDQKTMEKGDKFEFSFEIKEFEKIELSAKGYYLPI